MTGFLLRPPQPGDYGWIVQFHGASYAEEFGWDVRFEALIARIVSDFALDHHPERGACWIAAVDGEPAGSIFCMRKSDEVAQLRLLCVDPRTRGMGVGSGLVDECLRFARAHGYRKMILWTNDVLVTARHIYERAGFVCVKRERHRSFGHDLVGETWECKL